MTVAAWSLEWRWGGERGTVEPIDVTWTEQVALFDSQPAIRRADISCVLPIDVAAMTDRIRPSQGTAVLRRGSRVVMAGGWRDLRFAAPVGGRTEVEITIAEDELEDRGVWPPVGPWRPTAEDTTYRVYNTETGEITGADLEFATQQAIEHGAREGIGIYVNLNRWIRHTDFSTLANMTDGQTFPWPFGVCGDDSPLRPATPAWIVDTSGDGQLLVSGVPAACSTVTIAGPKKNKVEQLDVITGIDVHHATVNGRTYAYVKLSDVNGTLDDSNDGYAKPWYAIWPTAPRSGGAGSLLFEAYASSTLRADLSAFQALAPTLDRYAFAGYVDAQTTPSAWARDQILSLLPVSIVPGPLGLRPVLWPWISGDEMDGGPLLVDGVGLASMNDPVTYLSSDPVSRVAFTYGYRADTRASIGTVYASTATGAYGGAGADGGDDEIEAASIWDRATAASLAHARYRATAWTPRVVPVYVLDRRYDVGGDREMFVGDVVRFTSSRFGWTERPAVVGSIERDGSGNSRYNLYLRDDPLRVNG